MAAPPSTPARRGVPRLVVVAWAVAAALVAGLIVAVVRSLRDTGAGHDMAGMHGMSTADAITRGGAPAIVRPLLSSEFFTAWQFDAPALLVVVVLAALYVSGLARLADRAPGTRWPWPRTVSYFAGLVVIVFATCGSIAVYDKVLFTAHMAGHLCLVMVAPALLVAGSPFRLAVTVARPATADRIRAALRSRVVSALTSPPLALATYAAVIVGTHLTGVMDHIMRSTWAGQVEHLVFLLVGWQFFVLVVGDEPIRWRLSSPVRWLLLAVAMAVDTFTGIVLLQGTGAVALTPSTLQVNGLTDTRTGGAIMWVGGDGIMAVIMVALVVAWLRAADDRPDSSGWLEQARRAHFGETTGASTDDASVGDLDDADEARAAYNAYLSRLNGR
ncbi:MAG: cytochrome c oxidase assembly protein [Jatrophihabitans sp.]|uniref:cytochrome c oxidase assembly protein n=1 Tax=Jatrophihabitans sp. TaxID=1932789 RepID=UPI003F7D85A6